MNQLLILVQSENDAKNLTNAGKYLVQHGVKSAWVLVSPQVLVTSESASAQIDKEIADLRAQEALAAQAKKYGEAEAFSKQIDVKLMDKAQAVAVAYRDLTPEESQKRLQGLLMGIFEAAKGAGMNFKAQCEKVHYETGNFVNFLNATLAALPPGFEPGNFGIAWAGALSESQPNLQQAKNLVAPDAQILSSATSAALESIPKFKAEAPKPKFDPTLRRTLDELEGLPHFSLMAVGKHHKVWVQGIGKEALIRAIDSKQNANVAA